MFVFFFHFDLSCETQQNSIFEIFKFLKRSAKIAPPTAISIMISNPFNYDWKVSREGNRCRDQYHT